MPVLNVEHVACNVSDPAAMAAWYVDNLGMRILRRNTAAPYIHFLADARGQVAIEIYSNAADPVPDYRAQHPLRFHLAFAADDPTPPRHAGSCRREHGRRADAARWLTPGHAARPVGPAASTLPAHDAVATRDVTSRGTSGRRGSSAPERLC